MNPARNRPRATAAKRLAPMMSSRKHDWNTPTNVLDLVRAVGPIGLDPCSNATSRVDAAVALDGASAWADGLAADWRKLTLRELVFVNPPYGRALPKWLAKCAAEAERGTEIVALVPARPDTRAWQGFAAPPRSSAVCFWKGRMRFIGAPAPAPFPTALVYWGGRRHAFIDVFRPFGAIWS